MVCTEGNTNREYSFFGVGWWGFGWMEENKKSGGGDVRASKPAIGDGVLWTCKRRRSLKRSLGTAAIKKSRK